ncbi:MAG TPA: DUF4130 domain-containing protein [Ramlibacter sp.]|nr:DUF4130 domain-containing protein [Ramlibacter sp.]
METTLHGQTDLAGFRAQARDLLAHQVPPEQVQWLLDPQADAGFCDPESPNSSRPRNVARAATAIVPASFTRLCEFVVLHRDPQRFALLYRLLWRLVHEPGLRNDPLDPDMQHAQHMAHAVRRDIHKMKANVHLRTVREDGQEIQLACYQPAHHIMAAAASWFGKRIEAARWAILTPDRSVRCEHGVLLFGPGVPGDQMPAPDAPDEAWRNCYQRVYAAHDLAADTN